MGRLQCTAPHDCSHVVQGLHPSLFQPLLAPPHLESSRRQILITWQSHPRRLHGSPHIQGQHPKQLFSCLTGQVSHLELKNKPTTLQQTSVKLRELCHVPSRPQQSHRLQQERETPASSCLWPLFPPSTIQITQPQEAPRFFQI